ncbi:DUF4157 domain-containing protein [Streptomyces sp. TG1A-8]|uniref:eCIS core domain-containing protein n=1 Tax=Streptomyces sp. TG1A-8 TaxID=3051385 RepID=UPI00265C7D67|nr:DUF4157 domain-containing protein [Streptomyces sp. TG1A-8]MDO0924666.1 DUF4157 domain-containing protein [Streptomyces sp. TG1A-8]
MRGHHKRHEDSAAAGGTRESATARAVDPRHPERAAVPRSDAVIALQRLIGNAAVGEMLGRAAAEHADAAERRSALVRGVLRSPGRPLDGPVRADMEATLGADFSDVRLHTDRAAHESAASVAAQAYTSGSHIVFQRGRYDTASDSGREVLAHELTHVLQQRRGPVAGTDTGGGLAVSDPSDRFEREAERVAAGAGAGFPATAATAPGAGAGLPVARLLSVEEFRRKTTVGLLEKRGSSIEQVEQALAAYHRLPQTSYLARRRQLEKLRAVAEAYGGQSKSGRHQTAVDDLIAESHAESNLIRLPAVIEEILQQASAHTQIYQQLDSASMEDDPLAKARRLLSAQEAVLQQIRATGLGPDSDLFAANTNLSNWLNGVVNGLPEDDRRTLVEDDLQLLDAIRADTGAPQITRDVLGDLLAHRGIVKFTSGMPGTALSPAGTAEKYTLKHALYQPGGATERLGSLAHELTHVDAGETYAHSEILLLLRRDLSDGEVRDLVKGRKAEVDRLKTLLKQSRALTTEQEGLVAAKLQYAVEPKKGVGRYAMSFKAHDRIDDPTYQRLMHIEQLSAPNSSVLVEYDTVITQLLVYLHQWGVDQQEPFHAAVMRLAARLRADRTAARSANP